MPAGLRMVTGGISVLDGDIPLWVAVGAVVGFTVYALLLTLADVAFSTLPKTKLQQLKVAQKKGQTSPVIKWLDRQDHLFVTIVAGKTVTLVGVVVSAAALTFMAVKTPGIGALPLLIGQSILVIGMLLLVVEWLPRVWVKRHAESAVRFSSGIVLATSWILWPVIALLLKLSAGNLFSSGRNPYWLDDELHRVLELEEAHKLQPDDKEMISSIIELHDTSVREVMVPRVDMVCAETSIKLPELLKLIKEMGHSRIPIYQDSIDHIVGIVYAKDLLKYEELPESEREIPAVNLARPPYFVPETKKVDDLLREFQHEKTHMAIVVDEHGSIVGLVTLEDLLEEIVGEIQDEYDTEPPMYEQLPDGSILVDGKLNLDALNEMLELDLTANGYETIGGLVYDLLDRVPEPGEVLTYQNLRLTVQEIEGQRISKVTITKIAPVPESKAQGQ